ncbi:FAD/NAD(P)-binding domain-containing protein [Pseudovirgaria hyperparasitica]|uniref:FAD/NAD(P)-binding domain-containing protein n=1 Tax=Pseudovirgaria hyperparasitica TaxID=470096 RepID=A0A6A6WBD4_9PEZI|nr:FAD/NAD(P)-binding domain-containing protein [Pseudovirgaria hyperparasitica]KAF2759354.1 FAD/NAD(P)-binding domain-containing protein [Pseudovirgaria hyperparasitica]
MAPTIYDVLILGGGPAGLSVALGLSRQLRTCVVFDSQIYRNAPTSHMHNFPTWDHRDPEDFRDATRRNILSRYKTARFETRKVVEVKRAADAGEGKSEALFKASDDKGEEWWGRKVVLATGVRDVFPAGIQGYGDVWGKAVFHCLFCHGYEESGAPSAGVFADAESMLAKPQGALHGLRMAAGLAGRVTLYTNGHAATTAAMEEFFGPRNVVVEARRMVGMAYHPETPDERLHVTFEDGEVQKMGFMMHAPKTEVVGPWVDMLGLELTEMGVVKTNAPFYETTVKGVFAVGDIATPMKSVGQAVAMAGFAAAGIVGQLGAEFEGLHD